MGLNFGINSNKRNLNFWKRRSNDNSIFPARVVSIILDDKTHPELFKLYGGWDSIGTIEWQSTVVPLRYSQKPAKPLYPNFLNYPLENGETDKKD